jgi:hypothetical protein
VEPHGPAYIQEVSRKHILVGMALAVVALFVGVGSADSAAKVAPPAKPPPAKPPPKDHTSVSVGIAYSHGMLTLSSTKAGRAQIVMRSADGRRNWLTTVHLQPPTSTFRLKTLFPKITSGRYRIVVRPRFQDGFLSGAWITVAAR